jgi:hypothetical protein
VQFLRVGFDAEAMKRQAWHIAGGDREQAAVEIQNKAEIGSPGRLVAISVTCLGPKRQ